MSQLMQNARNNHDMQDYFYSLADTLFSTLQGEERLLLGFGGEDSDFVRLNHNRIRQAGHAAQRELSLDLVSGQRHAQGSVELSGAMDSDLATVEHLIAQLRDQISYLPDDPYLHYATEGESTEYHHDNEVVSSHAAVEQVIVAARNATGDEGGDLDLVGIFANGIQYSGYASSHDDRSGGQRHWHSSATFNFDWSCYLTDGADRDKAVKSNYAGFEWQADALTGRFDDIRHQLDILSRPAKVIEPGEYRAYLSPTAMSDIIGMMAWGGFGLKSHRTKTVSYTHLTLPTS